MPCQQGCLQALQQEPGIVVGDVAGLFAPKPSEKSQQSMANNTLPAAAASIFSPEGLAARRQVGRWKEAEEDFSLPSGEWASIKAEGV